MNYGLQIFDDSGRVTLDTSDHTGRSRGVLTFTGTGTLDVPRGAGERVFYFTLVPTGTVATAALVDASNPNVPNDNGGRISYSRQSGSGTCYLLYGVY